MKKKIIIDTTLTLICLFSAQGGASDKNSSVPLTAYVLAALIEAGAPLKAPFVKHATRCILSDKSKDPYTLALKTYALTLARNPKGKKLLRRLIDLAVVKKNALYWNRQAKTGKLAWAVFPISQRLSFEF